MPKSTQGCRYTGTEPSPKGLGHCAHLLPEGTVMRGRQAGTEWKVTADVNERLAWRKLPQSSAPRPAVLVQPRKSAKRKSAAVATKKGKKVPAGRRSAKRKTTTTKRGGKPSQSAARKRAVPRKAASSGPSAFNLSFSSWVYGEDPRSSHVPVRLQKRAVQVLKNNILLDYKLQSARFDPTGTRILAKIQKKSATDKRDLDTVARDLRELVNDAPEDGWMEGDISLGEGQKELGLRLLTVEEAV